MITFEVSIILLISNSWAFILCKNNEDGGDLKLAGEQSIPSMRYVRSWHYTVAVERIQPFPKIESFTRKSLEPDGIWKI